MPPWNTRSPTCAIWMSARIHLRRRSGDDPEGVVEADATARVRMRSGDEVADHREQRRRDGKTRDRTEPHPLGPGLFVDGGQASLELVHQAARGDAVRRGERPRTLRARHLGRLEVGMPGGAFVRTERSADDHDGRCARTQRRPGLRPPVATADDLDLDLERAARRRRSDELRRRPGQRPARLALDRVDGGRGRDAPHRGAAPGDRDTRGVRRSEAVAAGRERLRGPERGFRHRLPPRIRPSRWNGSPRRGRIVPQGIGRVEPASPRAGDGRMRRSRLDETYIQSGLFLSS